MAGGRATIRPGIGGTGIDILTTLSEADIKKASARLQMFPTKLGKKLAGQAGRAAAKVLRAEIEKIIPVRSGALKNSLKVRAAKSRKDGMKGGAVLTGKGFFKGQTYYGGMVEFGTRYQPEQSFMRKGVLGARNRVRSAWAKSLKKLMKDAANEVARK